MLNKWLNRDVIPCWYEMVWRGWEGELPAIILRVHNDFVQSMEPIPDEAPAIAGFKQQFGFAEFCGSFSGNFGFNNSFKRQGEKDGFLEFLVDIPVINKLTGKKCPECRGKRRNPRFTDMECFHCNGTGKEHEMDWKTAYAISASFTLFTAISQYPQIETSCPLPQLLTLYTITRQDMHGGSLGGGYSIPLVKYLVSLGRGANITAMVHAMKASYQRMIGGRDYDEHRFRASVDYENGWLNVDCPGDACGLHPSDGSDRWEGRGYEFSCHNVDSPMQQLTLIAGLAALYEKARRDIALYGSG